LLTNEIEKINCEVSLLEVKEKALKSDQATKTSTRTVVEIKEHAFDESDKFAKVHVIYPSSINGSKLQDEDVEFNLSDDSFNLVINYGEKAFKFIVNGLQQKIIPDKSYKKVKSDMISVYLKKEKEGTTWTCLTKTEKLLKDQKTKAFEADNNEGTNKDDPSSALMNLMKKMYDTGDPEMKKQIAKAWTEGQDKNRGMPPMF
jgi:calcyclin binding protein